MVRRSRVAENEENYEKKNSTRVGVRWVLVLGGWLIILVQSKLTRG